MEYVKKICPICENEFIVLKDVEKKAVYCTLECLLVSQERMEEENISPCMSV